MKVLMIVCLILILGVSFAKASDKIPDIENAIYENLRNAPCVAVQIDSHFFVSGKNIEVFARSGNKNCSVPPIADQNNSWVFYNPIWLSLSRWNGEKWIRIYDMPAQVPTGITKRQKITVYSGLSDGRYRLTIVNGKVPGPWFFLNAIYFIVGGTGDRPITTFLDNDVYKIEGKLPYIQPSRTVVNKTLYFRGYLGGNGGKFAKGYLYQVKNNETEFLPVIFEQVDNKEASIFVNQSFIKGGVIDLPWIKVNLPNNNLDPTRPIFASITAPGGGITIQGIIYDPLYPASFFMGF